MYKPWSVEIWRLAGALLAGLIIGGLLGAVAWCLFAAVLVYLGWQAYQLQRVYEWIRSGKRSDPIIASGIWDGLVYELHRLHQRSRRRKKKIAKLIRRFHESSAAMPDATVILGQTLEIEWFNGAAIELLELRLPQDIGRRITNLLRHPSFLAYIERGDYREAVEFPAGPDHQRQLNARLVPYGNKQFLLSVRDVTRLYRLEKMRRDFVANVSHELRTPLTVISGYLESLSDDPELDAQWQHSLAVMRSQSDRMQRLLEDLLTLARLETHENEQAPRHALDIPHLLDQVLADTAWLTEERQQAVCVDIDRGLWLKGASSELHSAFANLLSNAARYTANGGRISVRWYADEKGAHFEVEDTGIGIAAQHIPRLTERFYRVESGRSRDSGGTGLGLAIVKHVLGRHEASLRIESTLGKGSRFICDFKPERVIVQDLAA